MHRSFFLLYRLFVTGLTGASFLGKLISIFRDSPGIGESHPLIPIVSTSQILIAAIGLEGLLLVVLICSCNEQLILASVSSVYCIFAAYRLAVYTSGISFDCHCFGRLHEIFGMTASASNRFSAIALITILGWGLAISLIWSTPRQAVRVK